MKGRPTGIFTWFGYLIPLADRFQLIRETGFSHVVFWWGPEFEELDGHRTSHPDMARSAGLEIDSVHLPYADANDLWLDAVAGEALQERITGWISECSHCGVPTVVLHPDSGADPPPVSSKGLDRFRRLASAAEAHGVNLALENLHVPERLDAIFAGTDSPRLGFCYDSGHDHVFGGRGSGLLDRHAGRLMALHLHDNDGVSDQHRIPGHGSIDWPQLAKSLRASGYAGPLSLEVSDMLPERLGWEIAGSDPSQAARYLLEARAGLERAFSL